MELIDAGNCLEVMQQVAGQKDDCGIRDEVVVASILNETIKGLNYLHKSGRIHRDVKAGNILLNTSGNVFIADFGVSAFIKKGSKNVTLAGSPCWMAPEVMLKTGHDQKADIWSLGITTIELVLGKAPYSDFEYGKVIKLILQREPPALPDGPWSNELRSFINACLKKIPDDRPTLDELLRDHHDFLGKAKDYIFIQDNFCNGLAPLETRVPTHLKNEGDAFLREMDKMKKKK